MKTLCLIRHGLSQANVDESVYETTPDNRIELTSTGILQAEKVGRDFNQIKEQLPENNLRIIHSPWRRAKDTATIFAKEADLGCPITEDPLIYEQSVLHSYADMKQKEDYYIDHKFQYGEFWYKYATSESLADTYTRARLFVSDLRQNIYPEDLLIIVSHGVFINMVRGVIAQLSVQEILDLPLPKNCQPITIQLK